jgi:putative inorganic carbon (hco3(-)) transporter
MQALRDYIARYRLGYILRIISPYVIPALILVYILGGMYMLAYKRFYYYPYHAVPLVLFALYTAIFHLQNLVYVLAFATPLAISLKEMGLTQGPDLSIPTEPLMAGMMLAYMLVGLNRRVADRSFLRHPISTIIFVQLAWMFVTTCSSVDFVVSIKYLISRLWFIFSCYLIMQHLFKDRTKIIAVCMTYASALAIVVCYTTVVHARFNFNDKAADWVVSPFYNDHTAYGAALAMFIPLMVSFWFMRSAGKWLKIWSVVFFLMFTTAIILSFARAGWLSLAIVLCIMFTLLLKIKFRTLVLTFGSLALIFFVFQTDILMALGRNTTDAEGGLENNIASVSNISTDASNLERLNRWSCAIRMWEDKPVLGWGPGTYMFKYAPYQLSHQLTIISTNFGTNGNAHSEYLGPLAEQGVLGLVIVLVLLFYATSLGYRLVYSLEDRDDRVLCTGLFLGLMTYFVHGFFNNFLDTDKLSFPFWSFLAALVCFDLYYRKKAVNKKSLITGI